MTEAPAPLDAPQRPADLVLARVHLRLGSLALARAELESLAGRDALDVEGLVDLAEVRWRTGDIAGAGEAAVAALDDEEGPLVALVVAAEAAAARGRPTEARRIAAKAMTTAGDTLDLIFAGMPRASAWPPDPLAPPPSATTLFDLPRGGPGTARRGGRGTGATGADVAEPASSSSARTGGPTTRVPGPGRATPDTDPEAGFPSAGSADEPTLDLWAATTAETDDGIGLTADVAAEAEAQAEADLAAAVEEPDPLEELDRGRAALDGGRPDEAALRLGIVLRLAPSLAPAVLDVVVDRPEPLLAMIRGDAYRLVGREIDARRSFLDAVRLPDPVPTQPSADDAVARGGSPHEGEPT